MCTIYGQQQSILLAGKNSVLLLFMFPLFDLQGLKPYAEDAEFRKKWASVKYHNKQAFAAKLKEWTGVEVPIASLYDIHIKRIHEYKRQYMNMIATIYRYKTIKVRRLSALSLIFHHIYGAVWAVASLCAVICCCTGDDQLFRLSIIVSSMQHLTLATASDAGDCCLRNLPKP